MAGAGAGGNAPHQQDKSSFFASTGAWGLGEEQLAGRVEEARRAGEWTEGEGREAAHNTLWTQFQQTAAALTQLYRQEGTPGGGNGAVSGGAREEAGEAGRDWAPFQVAAGHLTMLYRESLEELRKSSELNRRLGYQKARADVVTWLRGRRGRNLRREELLAWLVREGEQEPRTGEPAEQRLAPVSDPATQHALLQMFELGRTGGEREGGRKRGVPGDAEEDMESSQSKKSRFH